VPEGECSVGVAVALPERDGEPLSVGCCESEARAVPVSVAVWLAVTGVGVPESVPLPDGVAEAEGVLLPVWEGEPDTLGECDCVKPVDSEAVAEGVPD
jgi:hypothetical protein